MRSVSLSFIFCIAILTGASQSAPYFSKKEKKRVPKMVLETIDGNRARVRILQASESFVLAEIKHFDKSKLPRFYTLPEGEYYRINTAFIRSISVARGALIGRETTAGLEAGLYLSGLFAFLAKYSDDEKFTTVMAWCIIGSVGTGGTLGFVSGLTAHKKFPVNGDSKCMDAFLHYCQHYVSSADSTRFRF